jgi:hypothetical protein
MSLKELSRRAGLESYSYECLTDLTESIPLPIADVLELQLKLLTSLRRVLDSM